MVEHYTKDGDGLPCMLTRVVDKIEKGASKRVEDAGNGQLHNACLKGDASTIKKLLSKKTDPIAMNALGRIPLQEAVRGGKLKAVEAILSSGVAFDLNHSDCA